MSCHVVRYIVARPRFSSVAVTVETMMAAAVVYSPATHLLKLRTQPVPAMAQRHSWRRLLSPPEHPPPPAHLDCDADMILPLLEPPTDPSITTLPNASLAAPSRSTSSTLSRLRPSMSAMSPHPIFKHILNVKDLM